MNKYFKLLLFLHLTFNDFKFNIIPMKIIIEPSLSEPRIGCISSHHEKNFKHHQFETRYFDEGGKRKINDHNV